MRRTKRLPLEQLAPYLLEVPDPPKPIAWPAVFGNDRPVELEVGFGKGLFLINAAQACPAVNFLGIEIERKLQLFTATRLAKRGLRNVRLVKGDARLFIRDCLAEESLQAIHVYFPDPWWKKRHLKRRVFTAEFAGQCERALQVGGQLRVATDVEDYFRVMTDLVGKCHKLRPLPPAESRSPQHDLDYLTNFERKFRKAGKPIWRGLFSKTAEAARESCF